MSEPEQEEEHLSGPKQGREMEKGLADRAGG